MMAKIVDSFTGTTCASEESAELLVSAEANFYT
jgi:hypothetical protein